MRMQSFLQKKEILCSLQGISILFCAYFRFFSRASIFRMGSQMEETDIS